ncbi:DNA-directed RNA polymerase subunit A' [archaeon]|nr:MAG: DNA-directed RNA polymerase subunit A' [archaeon]
MQLIKSINFGLLSPQMVKKMAAIEVIKAELYDNDGYPVEGGVMDPHLGVIDPGMRCRTCGGTLGDCIGHFGYIELVKPVIHILYVKQIYKLLSLTCFECGRLMEKKTTKSKCPHCGAEKKSLKLEKPSQFVHNGKMMTQTDVRAVLEKIPDEDLHKLGVKGGRPEWLVLTIMPVPPVSVRPSITLESGDRSEDDLTHKLVDIIRINQILKENLLIGAPDFILEDLHELLQYHISTFYDNELIGIPQARHRSGRPLKTLSQRLKTKDGRFRQNLTGKRVNFSARTVISPDPSISINEVGVPFKIAKDMTIPVAVTEKNIEYLRGLVKNGSTWPGANYVIRPDGRRKKVIAENAEEISKEITVGYSVERHLQNGDIVLFNRQPSLHRMSIMGHRVRITPWNTFTMNVCVCHPYNADFDGDEMNLHVLQNEEAQSEAELLMEVQRHIRSPRFGGPIIGCEQDHISGVYMLTRRGNELSREDVFSLLCETGMRPGADFTLGKKKYTGKEVFSMLLPKGLNIDFKAKAFRSCKKCAEGDCEHDAYVIIKDGELKAGVIDTKAIGNESGKLIDVIEKNYGIEEVHKFIDRVALLGIKYLQRTGISFGLSDVDISASAQSDINTGIEKIKRQVNEMIEKAAAGNINILPGKTLYESLETHIIKLLTGAMDEAEGIVSKDMKTNCALMMARSGARGGMAHLVQMAGVIGQEKILGERIHRGYRNRTLSHFMQGELSPEAHGFVTNSYKKGLNVFEFFFNSMSGRENLMDKSLRTKISGYMERRLMNALQDLKLEYDYTIRDNRKIIIQFVPGEDGIDPAKSDWGILDVRNIVRSVIK